MPTELFTIPPLKWKAHTRNGITVMRANAPIGGLSWTLYTLADGEWCLNPSGRSSALCASPEEGKRLAEEHWQSYIKQALVLVEGNHAD